MTRESEPKDFPAWLFPLIGFLAMGAFDLTLRITTGRWWIFWWGWFW